MILLLALVIGIVAGLRAMTAPAAVSWAARAGWLDLAATLAGVPGLCLHALDLDGAGAGRAGHRSAADDAQPHRADPVRRRGFSWGLVGRRDRRRAAAAW